MNQIVERIEHEAGVPGLVSILAERLTPTDLQSILLEVYRLRSRQLQPSAIVSNYETNRFVRSSAISPTQLLKWELVAFSQLPKEFEALTLSPVCPLGTNFVVASVDQNWAVATARNTTPARICWRISAHSHCAVQAGTGVAHSSSSLHWGCISDST